MWFPLQECEEPEPSHEHVSPGAAHALEKAVPQSKVPQGPILGHSAYRQPRSPFCPAVSWNAAYPAESLGESKPHTSAWGATPRVTVPQRKTEQNQGDSMQREVATATSMWDLATSSAGEGALKT